MDALLLKYFREKHGDTHARLAAALGVTDKTLQRKQNGSSEFTLSEIRAIIERYKLTTAEAWQVFFQSPSPIEKEKGR